MSDPGRDGVRIRVPQQLRLVGPPSWNRGLPAVPPIDRVDDRIMRFTALLDWEAAGYESFAVVRLGTEGGDPARVARDLADIPVCTSSAVVSGSADVQASFLLPDRDALHRLKVTELAGASGIRRMTVDLAIRSYSTPPARSGFLAPRIRDLWLPAPRVPLDAVDVGVIEALIADGRASHRHIGRLLGVSEGTVRARRARLEQAGLLSVVAMLNPLAFGQVGALGQVGLRVRPDTVVEVVAALRRVPEAVQVAMTAGAFDVVAAVAAPDRRRLAEVIDGEIAVLDGVSEVDTLTVEEIAHHVPFFTHCDGPVTEDT